MSTWKKQLRKWIANGSLAALMIAQVGCGSKDNPVVSPANGTQEGELPSTEQPKAEANGGMMSLTAIPVGCDLERYTQSFEDAAITEAFEGQQDPPDMTITGKGTGKLRYELEQIWPLIPLTSKGMTIPYVIQIETDEGSIEIALQPHLVPNQVRNFVALAKIGYYDGLHFDRLVHETTEDKQRIDMVIAGCPLGTGDDGYGHLCYTLKSQISPTLKHEEGTVGFWCEAVDKNACGCRFYITLGPTPSLDGLTTIVGKVTKGLEVVKRIAAKPVKGSTEPENLQPLNPIVMKKVTVSPDPLEKSPPVAQNR